MKKMFLLLAAFTLTTALFAQSKMDDNKMKSADHKMGAMKGKMQDCVMMEDGKMMVMKGGETMAMTQDENMTNGTTVMTDGTVKMKNGKTMKLKDGQCVYKSGKMGTMGKMKMDKMKDNKM